MSGHPGYGRDGKRLRPVEEMSAAELHAELVQDAVARYTGPNLPGYRRHIVRTALAYERIGHLQRPDDPAAGAEQAINDVLDEVETLTGLRALPIT